jgi:hypothetical protein
MVINRMNENKCFFIYRLDLDLQQIEWMDRWMILDNNGFWMLYFFFRNRHFPHILLHILKFQSII